VATALTGIVQTIEVRAGAAKVRATANARVRGTTPTVPGRGLDRPSRRIGLGGPRVGRQARGRAARDPEARGRPARGRAGHDQTARESEARGRLVTRGRVAHDRVAPDPEARGRAARGRVAHDRVARGPAVRESAARGRLVARHPSARVTETARVQEARAEVHGLRAGPGTGLGHGSPGRLRNADRGGPTKGPRIWLQMSLRSRRSSARMRSSLPGGGRSRRPSRHAESRGVCSSFRSAAPRSIGSSSTPPRCASPWSRSRAGP
jgi:hypothetical protein